MTCGVTRSRFSSAAAEPEQEARYSKVEDDVVFDRAQEDGRALITDNFGDFERARIAFERTGRNTTE